MGIQLDRNQHKKLAPIWTESSPEKKTSGSSTAVLRLISFRGHGDKWAGNWRVIGGRKNYFCGCDEAAMWLRKKLSGSYRGSIAGRVWGRF